MSDRLNRFATAKLSLVGSWSPSVLVLGCGLISKRLEVVDNVLAIFSRGKTFEGHEKTCQTQSSIHAKHDSPLAGFGHTAFTTMG
jgi:hypothetical protein